MLAVCIPKAFADDRLKALGASGDSPSALDSLNPHLVAPLQAQYQSYLKSAFLPKLSIRYQYINQHQQSHQSVLLITQQQEEQLFLIAFTWEIQPILDPYLFYQRLWYQSQYEVLMEQQVEQQPLSFNSHNALTQSSRFQAEALTDAFDQALKTSMAQGIDAFQVDRLTAFKAVHSSYATRQELQKALAIRHQMQLILAQSLAHLSKITQLGLLIELKKQALLYQLSLNPYHL